MKNNAFFFSVISLLVYFNQIAIAVPGRTLDKTLPVGTTPGSFNVSGSGAATYSIPIIVPPGTGGMQPSLSIEYNSQSGNGIMGIGWNLAGISTIKRTGSNFYHDGIQKGVDFTSGDNFLLDGQRLILVNSSTREYRTENETFSQIFLTNGAYGIDYFTVKTKGGLTIEYGKTGNSKIEAQNLPYTVLCWLVNKITDSRGNYMTFTYTEDQTNWEYRIAQIDYTGNAGASLSIYNKVVFTYETRADVITLYTSGSKLNMSQRLKKIETYCEGTKVKTYQFNYIFDGFSKLNEIIEYGTDGTTKFNSTVADWGTTTPSLQTVSPGNQVGESTMNVGDFNGDGQSDLINFRPDEVFGRFIYYSANPDGISFTQGVGPKTFKTNYESVECFIANLDGDEEDDRIMRYDDEDGGIYTYKFHCSLRGNSLPDSLFYAEGNIQYIGDFDGDGLDDLVIADPEIDKWYMFSLSYINGTLSPLILKAQGSSINWEDTYLITKRLALDFNNDGKQELLVLHPGGFEIDRYNGSDFVALTSGSSFNASYIVTWGDYNGDGNTDFYIRSSESDKGTIKFSTGTGFVDGACSNLTPFSWKSHNNYYSEDINGDGYCDLVVIGRGTATTGNADIYVALSTGVGFGSFSLYDVTEALNVSDAYNLLGDFNGDGNTDYLYNNGVITRLYTIYRGMNNKLVKNITNGLNMFSTINYKPMTDDNGFYSKGAVASFPLSNVQMPLYMVSTIKQSDGLGDTTKVNFTYSRALAHQQGIGWLGFGSTTMLNTTTNISITNTQELNTVFYYYTPSYVLTETSSGTNIDSVKYTNAVKDFGSKRIFPYITQVYNKNFLSGVETCNVYTYNSTDIDYGNITSECTKYLSNGYLQNTNTYTYVTVDAWCPSKVSKITTNKNRYPLNSFIRTVDYTYNTNGTVINQIIDKGKAKACTTAYTYDNCGNELTATASTSGLTSRTSTITYDPKYRSPLTKKNGLNHISSYVTDFKFGVITQETDPNLNVTNSTYDKFGRKLTTNLPTGKVINKTLAWIASGGPANGLYTLTTTSDSSATIVEYFDMLGRKLRTTTTGFNSASVNTDIEYYKSGNQKRVSEPYVSGETVQWTTNYFDAYQRLDYVTSPTCSLNYEYSGTTVTITDCNGKSASKTYNNAGELTTATDNGGTISYAYHQCGQVKQILAAGGTTTMDYDEYGMQTILTDPDAGTYKYYYNAYGELVAQQGPKLPKAQDSTSFTYDVLGRLSTQKVSEGTITFTYDNATKGKGMLQTVSSYYGSATYTYDNYSRIKTYTETIEGTSYPFTYNYGNKVNNVVQMTYPSGFSVKQEYDAAGYIKKIKRADNSALIWECKNVNSFGQLKEMLFGNNLTTYQTFDSYGYPVTISTQNSGGTKIQDLGYSFSTSTGNLTWRKDNLTGRGLTENFLYDNLDRLLRATVSANAYYVNYYNNGNIQNKTDAGTVYNYDASKVHAMTSITGNTGTISSTTQKTGYYSFDKVRYIGQGTDSVFFYYGYNNDRRKMMYYNNKTLSKTTYYLGNYEKEIYGSNTRQIHYITSPVGIVAIFVKNAQDTMYYMHKDYLGSLLCITNSSGAVVEERSFDAWGRRRNPTTWTYTSVAGSFKFTRGYTSHEHLDKFGLINMNGRMYDPVVGRFLSPDKYVQSATYTQSYNRYTYCLNNPLKYSDPSGYISDALWRRIMHMSYWNPPSRIPQKDGKGGHGYYPNNLTHTSATQSNFVLMTGTEGSAWVNISDITVIPEMYWQPIIEGKVEINNSGYLTYSYYDPNVIYDIQIDNWIFTYKGGLITGCIKLGANSASNNGVASGGGGDENNEKRGWVISEGNVAAAYGSAGGMIDVGIVIDSHGNASHYLTIGWVLGYGASCGVGISRTTKDFNLQDFEGNSEGAIIQVPFTPITIEGYRDLQSGSDNLDYLGMKYSGIGVNVGPGDIYGVYISKTILLPDSYGNYYRSTGNFPVTYW
jgi:RHS repeat-associated protein